MKVLLILLMASSALAFDRPLITKTSNNGFAPLPWNTSEICEIWSDKAVIKKTYANDVEVIRSFPIQTSGITKAIGRVGEEKFETEENDVCDGPRTTIGAGIGSGPEFVLYSTGGCGEPKFTRIGPYSTVLRNIVNDYCPTTY